MNICAFDIETVPDVAAGRRLHNLPADLADSEMAEILYCKRRQETGSDFLRLYLHRVVAISVVLRSEQYCKVWSVGDPESSEQELIERFFSGIEKYTPTLVSWNGSGFDLPVLHYRALLHGICTPRYWEVGDNDTEFRWNNYLNRFHWRHTDLMDVLSGYQGRATAPLDEIASFLGFPGKLGMHGSKVWECFQGGDIARIRDYCETDALNTYLVYLRFELIRGRLVQERYEAECQLLREVLTAANKSHLHAFLTAWQSQGSLPPQANNLSPSEP